MSELIKGKLTIQNSNGSGTAIELNGNALPQTVPTLVGQQFSIGGKLPKPDPSFLTGQLDIKDNSGEVVMSLRISELKIQNKVVSRSGFIGLTNAGSDNNKIELNGIGVINVSGDGLISINDDDNKKLIELNGSERTLTIHTQLKPIKLDAQNGVITNGRMKLMANGEIEIPRSMRLEKGWMRLGAEPDGQGDAGGLIIHNGDGKDVIELDAAGPTIHVLDNLKLDNGVLRLGSEPGKSGPAGMLFLRNAAGEETVRLDGENARIHINKAAGEIIAIPGMLRLNNGDLRLGGEPKGGGADGSLRLRNAAGKETIFLDGQQGDILLHNADCAEEFDVVAEADIEPGTVMVLDDDGRLHPNRTAYCRKVAGVVSGAGEYKPGLVLDKKPGSANRVPIALMGKVFCKVDAQYGAIGIGDLLTTSPTVGHAMKAQDPAQAFGAVLGKALWSLTSGMGLIPILVSLQ